MPVPQIYYNAPPKSPTQAQRWTTLATLDISAPKFILGALTEWQACQDPKRSCSPGYNAPVQAWQQVMDELYTLIPDPNMVQKVIYSSDITWQN